MSPPIYVLEYLLGMYTATKDEVLIQEGVQKVKEILANNYVRPDEKEIVKSKIKECRHYKIIDKIFAKLKKKKISTKRSLQSWHQKSAHR